MTPGFASACCFSCSHCSRCSAALPFPPLRAAPCCSVLLRVARCCSALLRAAPCCSVLLPLLMPLLPSHVTHAQLALLPRKRTVQGAPGWSGIGKGYCEYLVNVILARVQYVQRALCMLVNCSIGLTQNFPVVSKDLRSGKVICIVGTPIQAHRVVAQIQYNYVRFQEAGRLFGLTMSCRICHCAMPINVQCRNVCSQNILF